MLGGSPAGTTETCPSLCYRGPRGDPSAQPLTRRAEEAPPARPRPAPRTPAPRPRMPPPAPHPPPEPLKFPGGATSSPRPARSRPCPPGEPPVRCFGAGRTVTYGAGFSPLPQPPAPDRRSCGRRQVSLTPPEAPGTRPRSPAGGQPPARGVRRSGPGGRLPRPDTCRAPSWRAAAGGVAPGRSPPVPQGTAGWGPSPRAVCEETRQGRGQDTPVRAGRLLSPRQLPHLRENLRSLRPLSRSYTAKWRLWGRAVPAPPPAPSPPRPGPRAPLPAGRGAAPGSRQGRAGSGSRGDGPAHPGPLSCLCRPAPSC